MGWQPSSWLKPWNDSRIPVRASGTNGLRPPEQNSGPSASKFVGPSAAKYALQPAPHKERGTFGRISDSSRLLGGL